MHALAAAVVQRGKEKHMVFVRWKVGDLWDQESLSELRGWLMGDKPRRPDVLGEPIALGFEQAVDLVEEIESRQYTCRRETFCLARERLGGCA